MLAFDVHSEGLRRIGPGRQDQTSVFDNGEIRTDAPGVPQFRYAADAMFNRGAASTVFASQRRTVAEAVQEALKE